MHRLLLFLLLLLLYAQSSVAQSNYVNIRTSLNYPATVFTGIYPTDSCVYIKGVMTDTLFRDGVFWAKTSLDGSILSLTEIVETKKAYNSWDPKIRKNKNENFVFGGTVSDVASKGFIIELSPEGKTLRYKEFFSPLYPAHPFIYVSSVHPLPNGGYAATGNLANVTQENTLIAKFDDDFNLLFSRAFGTTKYFESGMSTAIDNQNNILLGGREFRQSIEKNIVSRKTITRLDSLGENITFQWKWPQADFPKWRGWSVYEMLVEPDGSILGASAITEEIPWKQSDVCRVMGISHYIQTKSGLFDGLGDPD